MIYRVIISDPAAVAVRIIVKMACDLDDFMFILVSATLRFILP